MALKRIEVIATFQHGGQTFHATEVRLVSPEDAAYFCGAGWAKAEGLDTAAPNTDPVTLDVQNVVVGHAAQNAE